jgi:hypothetical protein
VPPPPRAAPLRAREEVPHTLRGADSKFGGLAKRYRKIGPTDPSGLAADQGVRATVFTAATYDPAVWQDFVTSQAAPFVLLTAMERFLQVLPMFVMMKFN